MVPGRGLIFDRKGRIVADNVPAYRLDVTPSESGDSDAVIAGLSRIIALDADEIALFHSERKATRGFRPITLKLRLDEE